MFSERTQNSVFVTFECSQGQFYELAGRFALGGEISFKDGEFRSQTWRMGYSPKYQDAYFEGPQTFVKILDALGYEPMELPF